MTFKELVSFDTDKVFFNIKEFASLLVVGNYAYEEEISKITWSTDPVFLLVVSQLQQNIIKKVLELKCIFETVSEVILDGSSEFGESAATLPSILLKSTDAKKIEYKHSLEVEGNLYALNYKNEEDVHLTRLFLEKKH